MQGNVLTMQLIAEDKEGGTKIEGLTLNSMEIGISKGMARAGDNRDLTTRESAKTTTLMIREEEDKKVIISKWTK